MGGKLVVLPCRSEESWPRLTIGPSSCYQRLLAADPAKGHQTLVELRLPPRVPVGCTILGQQYNVNFNYCVPLPMLAYLE